MIVGIDYNNYTTVIEAPPWWQTWGVGMAGGAVAGLFILLGLWALQRRDDREYEDDIEQVGEISSTGNSSGPRLHLEADEPGWFARLRERFRSHDIEDATYDEPEPGGWTPRHRNVIRGDDGELHPIDEAAQNLQTVDAAKARLQEQEARDG